MNEQRFAYSELKQYAKQFPPGRNGEFGTKWREVVFEHLLQFSDERLQWIARQTVQKAQHAMEKNAKLPFYRRWFCSTNTQYLIAMQEILQEELRNRTEQKQQQATENQSQP